MGSLEFKLGISGLSKIKLTICVTAAKLLNTNMPPSFEIKLIPLSSLNIILVKNIYCFSLEDGVMKRTETLAGANT